MIVINTGTANNSKDGEKLRIAFIQVNSNFASVVDNYVQKISGRGLSSNDFTTAEKSKLANLTERWRGVYISLSALQTAFPSASPGDTANVDAGVAMATKGYMFDAQSGWIPFGNDGQVTSVNGQIGVVNLTTNNVGEEINLYFTQSRVTNNVSVLANTAKVGITPQQAAEIAANTAKIGNQLHIGEVTGAQTLIIQANVVTNLKLAQMSSKTYKGRTTAGTGNVEDLTAGQMRIDLGIDQVNNTSDSNKPISSSTQIALNAKSDSGHSHTFASITSRPTTLDGYGITDGVTIFDGRLTNARPASDVFPWAKNNIKPSYVPAEIGSPGINGSGATGNWGINITGNAATATTANSSNISEYSATSGSTQSIRHLDGPRDLSNRPPNWSPRSFVTDFVIGSVIPGNSGNYAGVVTFSPWDGESASTGDSSYQLAFCSETGNNDVGLPGLKLRKGINSSWGSWFNLVHSGNIGSQVLAKSQRANGNFYIDDNHGCGVIGLYNASRYQGIYTMGDAYKMSLDGTNLQNHFGLAWTHTNMGGQSKPGLQHQMLITANGETQSAIGVGIWTKGSITTTGNMFAVSYFGTLRGAIAGPTEIFSTQYGSNWGTQPTIRELNRAGAQGNDINAAPSLTFHWSGLVAMQLMLEANNRLSVRNGAGTGYENLICATSFATDFVGTSDRTLKENITELEPKNIESNYHTFNFIADETKQVRYGVIAQELEINHPEFVRTDSEGIKSVSYLDLHSAEIAYLKSENESLKVQLDMIMKKLETLCQ